MVIFSFDDQLIISGSYDKTIKIWEKESGKEFQILKGHSHSVNSVAISKDNKYIISGSSDKTIKIWETENYKEI